jgi:pimeloyl-ACP methyl ester carboxylesterase
MTMISRSTLAASLAASLAATLVAAPASAWAQTTPQAPAPTAPKVTRADLAAAYMRVDAAYTQRETAKTLPDSVRAQINRMVDRAALSFFSGQFAAAVSTSDAAQLQWSGVPVASTPVASTPVRGPRALHGAPVSAARDEYLARLAAVDSTGPLAQALLSTRERAKLLVDVPSPERSAEFLHDPATLSRDLAREVSVLERGRDPYIGLVGDFWRVYRGANNALVPMRIVAPPSANVRKPVGVLLVLHGAGGDENMFVDAYGSGIVSKLAAEQRLILVSPRTDVFGVTPAHFDALMALLRNEFRIDSTRVYLIGHSMGAGAAARLVQARPAQFAAVAMLAGGSPITVPGAPPSLYVGAELDGIIPAARVEAAAKATPGAVYELFRHEGHLLMVGNGVRRAVPWLVSHTR